jgi:hypothetical protein
MTIRKFVGIILSAALIIGGFWITFAVITSDEGSGRLISVGPFLVITGGVWIYSDWFE